MVLIIEGGREFLKLSLTYDWVDALPWAGFLAVKKALEPHRVQPEELKHCYTELNHQGMVAVFEVVRHV